ncbi:hypothetical protein HDU76_001136 [Blyttiomyces sp. JEL0837]|nr:hypothetical protein HDU76_001136 [Blyttiomyces sp. JEL0837]
MTNPLLSTLTINDNPNISMDLDDNDYYDEDADEDYHPSSSSPTRPGKKVDSNLPPRTQEEKDAHRLQQKRRRRLREKVARDLARIGMRVLLDTGGALIVSLILVKAVQIYRATAQQNNIEGYTSGMDSDSVDPVAMSSSSSTNASINATPAFTFTRDEELATANDILKKKEYIMFAGMMRRFPFSTEGMIRADYKPGVRYPAPTGPVVRYACNIVGDHAVVVKSVDAPLPGSYKKEASSSKSTGGGGGEVETLLTWSSDMDQRQGPMTRLTAMMETVQISSSTSTSSLSQNAVVTKRKSGEGLTPGVNEQVQPSEPVTPQPKRRNRGKRQRFSKESSVAGTSADQKLVAAIAIRILLGNASSVPPQPISSPPTSTEDTSKTYTWPVEDLAHAVRRQYYHRFIVPPGLTSPASSPTYPPFQLNKVDPADAAKAFTETGDVHEAWKRWSLIWGMTERALLRRLLYEQLFPIKILRKSDDQMLVEYFDLDVFEDKGYSYPWIVKLVEIPADEVFKSLDGEVVKLFGDSGILTDARDGVIICNVNFSSKFEDGGDGEEGDDGDEDEFDEILAARREAIGKRRGGMADQKREKANDAEALENLGAVVGRPAETLNDALLNSLIQFAKPIIERLEPPQSFDFIRQRFLQKMQRVLDVTFGDCGAQARLFGSSSNGLGNAASDVDITIMIPNGQDPTTHICSNMLLMTKNLRFAGMQDVVPVLHAKVPICKFHDPEFNLSCDVNVGNMLGVENSRLVWTYLQMDPRLLGVILLVKHWARQRNINDPASGGTPSSYAYVLMVICFFQERGLLPSLQELYHREDGLRRWIVMRKPNPMGRSRSRANKKEISKEADRVFRELASKRRKSDIVKWDLPRDAAFARQGNVESVGMGADSYIRLSVETPAEVAQDDGLVAWDVSFAEISESSVQEWVNKAGSASPDVVMKDTVRLFYEFVRFYGYQYEFSKTKVVSARLGKILDGLTPALSANRKGTALVVEDPFQLDRNTTGMVSNIRTLVEEFRRAANILAEAGAEASSANITAVLDRVFESAPVIQTHSQEEQSAQLGERNQAKIGRGRFPFRIDSK